MPRMRLPGREVRPVVEVRAVPPVTAAWRRLRNWLAHGPWLAAGPVGPHNPCRPCAKGDQATTCKCVTPCGADVCRGHREVASHG